MLARQRLLGPNMWRIGVTHHDNRHFAFEHFVEAAGCELQHGPILLVEGRGTGGQQAHSQRQGAAEQPRTPHDWGTISVKRGNGARGNKA